MKVPDKLNDLEQLIAISVHKVKLNATLESKLFSGLDAAKNHASGMINGDGVDLITEGWNTAASFAQLTKDSIDILKDSSAIDYTLDKAETTIFLPLPNNIRESYAQNFETSNINMEEKLLRTAIPIAKKAVGLLSSDVANGIDSTIERIQHIATRSNLSIDPNTLMVYGGSVPRHITMDFSLTPSDAHEAQYYSDIASSLRALSLATRYTTNFYDNLGIRTLRMNNCFTLKAVFKNGNSIKPINKLINMDKISTGKGSTKTFIGGFYLSNVSLTIGGQDSLQLFYDGKAKNALLSLTFIERQPLWRTDWESIERSKDFNTI